MRLTDNQLRRLEAPTKGNKVYYDDDVKGFGVRVTTKGAQSFILNYRTRTGRERRYTIGQPPAWSVKAAREEAGRLKRLIRDGHDPLAELESDREAKTVADLCERYIDEHLPRKRPTSQRDDRAMIDKIILPELKHYKVAETTFSDIDGLHRKITKGGAPIRANRVIALLSKMFALSIRWGWRADNPAKGIQRNDETKRTRYLTGDEIGRLTLALSEHDDQQAANAIRLMLLTGARRGEVLSARWADMDLQAGVWTKPGATTKQKTAHRVPLSAPAMQLLAEMKETADDDAEHVFPGRGSPHRVELKHDWAALCKAANITGVRMHDLRHTYASILASAGLSLPVIGALLGHTQAQTTARYSHLFDDPLRAATDRVGAIVTGGDRGEVIKIGGGR